jgi:molybdenum cofactor synthesis domain-containing protein
MTAIEVLSVNSSPEKGTIKYPVNEIVLNEKGVTGDAHAGNWNRQVSLLGIESFLKMESTAGRPLKSGDFAENITTKGFPLYEMQPLDRLKCREIVLEVTQIGKKCHGSKCTIFRQTGDCVMPKEGIFSRVLQGGILKKGDILQFEPKEYHVAVITLSDRASKGEYEDESGALIRKMIQGKFSQTNRNSHFDTRVIPDDAGLLSETVKNLVDQNPDFIFTTGGTGIGPRDITPDIIKPMLHKEIPGIMEMIRVKFGMQFANALLSRSIAGVINKTLVFVLPGSPHAVADYLGEIIPTLEHSVLMLHGLDKHI